MPRHAGSADLAAAFLREARCEQKGLTRSPIEDAFQLWATVLPTFPNAEHARGILWRDLLTEVVFNQVTGMANGLIERPCDHWRAHG